MSNPTKSLRYFSDALRLRCEQLLKVVQFIFISFSTIFFDQNSVYWYTKSKKQAEHSDVRNGFIAVHFISQIFLWRCARSQLSNAPSLMSLRCLERFLKPIWYQRKFFQKIENKTQLISSISSNVAEIHPKINFYSTSNNPKKFFMGDIASL